MHLKALCALAAAALLLTACTKSETPAEVARDVEKAQADGQREVADARADVQQANADADKQVADAIADRDPDDVARQAYDANQKFDEGKSKIVIAQAEADHKVAVQKCEGLEGSAQKDCKDTADKTLEQAKESAKVNR
jgi:regulator of protease activity HflC (stomatin/prohibitin superfamily)